MGGASAADYLLWACDDQSELIRAWCLRLATASQPANDTAYSDTARVGRVSDWVAFCLCKFFREIIAYEQSTCILIIYLLNFDFVRWG